jgi:hypothetical protein
VEPLFTQGSSVTNRCAEHLLEVIDAARSGRLVAAAPVNTAFPRGPHLHSHVARPAEMAFASQRDAVAI